MSFQKRRSLCERVWTLRKILFPFTLKNDFDIPTSFLTNVAETKHQEYRVIYYFYNNFIDYYQGYYFSWNNLVEGFFYKHYYKQL